MIPETLARTLLLTLLLAAPLGNASGTDSEREDTGRGLRHYFETLEPGTAPVAAGRRLRAPVLLAGLYRSRGHQPLWTAAGPLAGRVPELLDAIADSTSHGLNADDYHASALRTLLEAQSQSEPIDLELLASDAFLQQARHRANGAVSPRDLDPEWHLLTPEVDTLQILLAAVSSTDEITTVLDRLWPASVDYHALVRYRDRQLSQSKSARIDSIDANLERWRWLPREQPATLVRVNIADFSLEVIERGETALAMDVIVGLPFRRTPVFAAAIEYMVFNPYWYVPQRLAIVDKLPALKRDAARLEAQGFEVRPEGQDHFIPVSLVDWSTVDSENFRRFLLRQRPGPANALGQVKLMLPNPYDVYLHDTPTHDLFGSPERCFSSGCVRLEQAEELAHWLLVQDDQAEQAARIRSVLDSGDTVTVRLQRPVPVQVVYFTAFANATGDIVFRRDVYDRDGALVAALREGSPP